MPTLDEAAENEIIEMALSDQVKSDAIRDLHGLDAEQVRKLMRSRLRTGSYRAWRKRVRGFRDLRAHYK